MRKNIDDTLKPHPAVKSSEAGSLSQGLAARFSRRGFLKGLGSSVIATAAASTGLVSTPKVEAYVPPVCEGLQTRTLRLKVNGLLYRLEVEPRRSLADVLRKELGLTGTKISCNRAECGACTVIMNGKTVYSCTTLAVRANGKEITTVEGLAQGNKLHPIQEAFIEFDAYQCGFCTPGVLVACKALLDRNPRPTRDQIKFALSGNLCRCAAYNHIFAAVEAAAKKL